MLKREILLDLHLDLCELLALRETESFYFCNWIGFSLVKACGQKSLPLIGKASEKTSFIQPARAKSARAVTGRQCPHSGVGEEFLVRRPGLPTKTAVTRKRKVEKSIRRCKIHHLAEYYKQAIEEVQGPIAKKKQIFGPEPEFWAPKKTFTF